MEFQGAWLSLPFRQVFSEGKFSWEVDAQYKLVPSISALFKSKYINSVSNQCTFSSCLPSLLFRISLTLFQLYLFRSLPTTLVLLLVRPKSQWKLLHCSIDRCPKQLPLLLEWNSHPEIFRDFAKAPGDRHPYKPPPPFVVKAVGMSLNIFYLLAYFLRECAQPTTDVSRQLPHTCTNENVWERWRQNSAFCSLLHKPQNCCRSPHYSCT